MRVWPWILTLGGCLFTALACVTPIPAHFGIQAEQLAKIPARIAVLPCRLWPQGALYAGQEATTLASESEIRALCTEFDAYVLKGFDGQPYMRGLSPKVVQALLAKSNDPKLLEQFEELWFKAGQNCEACRHPASLYQTLVAPKPEWRIWLGTLSRSVSASDALLLPLIVSIKAHSLDDRGLFYAQKKAALALLLIDTNNGSLIWVGGREAEIRRPLVEGQKTAAPADFAPWSELWRQLFVEDLWREFPGRQN